VSSIFCRYFSIDKILLTFVVPILQELMELESQYGVLPSYTPVMDDIMTFISKVRIHIFYLH
jgi:hypothetical protein